MKYIYILFLCSFTTLFANKILEKKLEILELMQKDNIENINTIYADLLHKHNIQKSKELRLKAANNSNKEALRIVGFKLFEDGKTQEGLTLLCEASILGNINVARDLHLMPILLNITQQEIESACKLASINIKEKSKSVKNQKIFIIKENREKLNRFEYDRDKKKLSYYNYLEFLTLKMLIFTEAGYANLSDLTYIKEKSRVKKNKRIHKEKLAKENASWKENAYYDRKNSINSAISNLMEISEEADAGLIEEELNYKLSNFNKLRSKNRKITSEDIWKIVKGTK